MARIYMCDCGSTHARTSKKRVVNGVTEMYQVWTCNGKRREMVYARIDTETDALLSFGLASIA